MNIHRFSFPTSIHFGPGARHQVKDHVKSRGWSRVLVVTDRGVALLPFLRQLVQDLSSGGMEAAIFSEVWGNPVKSQVAAGVAAFKQHRADSILGVGGGAALDVAKAVALMATHPGDLFDYEDDKPGARPIDGPLPPWVALPTTAGTGSEVGRSSVISDEATHIKKIIFSPRLLAQAVFADPEVTLNLPAAITAATGMDALTHCVEAYLAKGYHPICDGVALEGLKLAARSLRRCVQTPDDIEARGEMMMASMMGAIAFQKGLGVTHSCAHALGTAANMHHGLANGVMIDHALKINVATAPDRFRQMTLAVEAGSGDGTRFLDWLRRLKADIGIPARLVELGIGQDQLERLARLAVEDSCHQNNPRPCTRRDFEQIFNEAL